MTPEQSHSAGDKTQGDKTQGDQTQGDQTQGAFEDTRSDLSGPLTGAFEGSSADQDQAVELGQLGDYRLIGVMGIGGMGIVYRAEDSKLKRAIALKVMRPEIAASETSRKRFLREAQSAARIDHENIVTIYQVGEDNGVPFIAMRYLNGETLKTKLRREGRVDSRVVAEVGRQVATGLAAAHEQGLIHRDIKPENIWMEAETGRVKILDFGLARTPDADVRLTQSGSVLGTPKYMSPEQATGKTIDHRSDLFSLGSVLYRLLSGKEPFDGGNSSATLIKVTQAEFDPIEKVCRRLDPELARLINKLLEKAPAKRPQTAREVAEALAKIEKHLESQQEEQARRQTMMETAELKPPDEEALTMIAAENTGKPILLVAALIAVAVALLGLFAYVLLIGI